MLSAQTLGLEAPEYIVIDEMLAEEGDTISDGQTIATFDTGAMQDYLEELEQQITETQISIDTLGNVTTSFSIKSPADGWVKNVMLDDDDNESFKLAMTLNCEIKTQEASNVILAPVDAVRTSGNKSYAMVELERSDEQIETIKQLIMDSDYTELADYLGEDAASLGINVLSDWSELLYGEIRAVETGLQNAFYVEIKSGLSEGEGVLLTESDSSSDFDMFMMEAVQEMPGGFQPGSAGGDRPSGGVPSGMGGN